MNIQYIRKSKMSRLWIAILLLCALLLSILIVFVSRTPVKKKKIEVFSRRVLTDKFGISPDGSKIAYTAPAQDKFGDMITEIWVANIDGSDKHIISKCSGFPDIGWYDNSHLTKMEYDVNHVDIISLDGKQKNLSLTDQFSLSQSPFIAPNGKFVAFLARLLGVPHKSGVFLLEADSGRIRILSEAIVTEVSWSPDSKKIAYGEGNYSEKRKLKIINIETGKILDTGVYGYGVGWSPDGKWLAFATNFKSTWDQLDGTIVKMNIETREMKNLTEPGINVKNKLIKHREVFGSFSPIWSPDGKKIAYYQYHHINHKNTLNDYEIWVMNADGSNRKRLSIRNSSFIWAPDSKALLIKTEIGINKTDIDTGKSKDIIVLDIPKVPAKTSVQTIQNDNIKMSYSGVRPEYAKAILKVAGETKKLLKETFGFNLPEKVNLSIEKVYGLSPSMETDYDSNIYLFISSNLDFEPPMKSGVYNIFGICREFASMAMFRKVKMFGFPPGVKEGWAYYAGSVAVDNVYKKLGANVWPQSYDYSNAEGTARLASFSSIPGAAISPNIRAALVFYKLQQRYGEDDVMAAMKTAFESEPLGKDVMPRFIDALVKITNDETARAMVPKELLIPIVDWRVANREINEETTMDQKQVMDSTGVILKCDDGTSEKRYSNYRDGNAIIYLAPKGNWSIDYVQVFASRYGQAYPPKKNFLIFICDQDFNVIKQIEKPYSIFETGDPKWYTLNFDPVKVPRGFYVCIYFEPATKKNVFIWGDADVKKPQSRSALPWTYVKDLRMNRPFEYMIRAHLIKSSN